MKILAILFSAVLVLSGAQSQFMGGFAQQMDYMNSMMGNMFGNIMDNNQRMFAEGMRQANTAGANSANVPPGTRETFNNGNTRGFRYRSPDGSFSSFSFASGPGAQGFAFQDGPNGFFQQW